MIWLIQNNKVIPTRDSIGFTYPYGPYPTSAFPNSALPDIGLNWVDNHGSYTTLFDEWNQDGLNNAEDNTRADKGDYWAQTNDEFFVRIKHSRRDSVRCAAKYLGVTALDAAGCVAENDFVDASIVPLAEAPIVSVKLMQAVEFEENSCYFWRIQIVEGPCAGYYLDQNHSVNSDAQETHITRWSKNPMGSDV